MRLNLQARERECERLKSDLMRLQSAARQLRDRYVSAVTEKPGAPPETELEQPQPEELSGIKTRLGELSDMLDLKGSECLRLRRQLEARDAELVESREEAEQLRRDLGDARSEIEGLSRRLESEIEQADLEQSLRQARATIDNLQQQLAAKIMELGRLEGEAAAAREALKDTREVLDEREREVMELQNRLRREMSEEEG